MNTLFLYIIINMILLYVLHMLIRSFSVLSEFRKCSIPGKELKWKSEGLSDSAINLRKASVLKAAGKLTSYNRLLPTLRTCFLLETGIIIIIVFMLRLYTGIGEVYISALIVVSTLIHTMSVLFFLAIFEKYRRYA